MSTETHQNSQPDIWYNSDSLQSTALRHSFRFFFKVLPSASFPHAIDLAIYRHLSLAPGRPCSNHIPTKCRVHSRLPNHWVRHTAWYVMPPQSADLNWSVDSLTDLLQRQCRYKWVEGSLESDASYVLTQIQGYRLLIILLTRLTPQNMRSTTQSWRT